MEHAITRRIRRVLSSAMTLAVLAALVVAVAAWGTTVLASVLSDTQQRLADETVQRRLALMGEVVEAETGRYVEALRLVAAAAGTAEPLTAAAFARMVEPLKQTHLPGATSITFLVPATDAQIPAVQARWRARGVPP
nr:hypothetical protein GCM10020093_032880 [Planobispora longispora]